MKNIFRSPLPYVILSVLILAGYYDCFTHRYLLDDHLVLFGESGVANKSFLQLFTINQESFYRPVGHIVLWMSFHLFHTPFTPIDYHLINFVLFTAVVCLFYKIVLDLTADPELAFCSSCLYAIHPINGMHINYITANVITLSVLFQQISILLFIDQRKRDGKGTALSLFFFLLSLLSHEMSILLPLYIFIITYFMYKSDIKFSLILSRPYILLLVLFLLFRMYFHPILNPFKPVFPVVMYLGTYFVAGCELIGWYLSKLIYPSDILFLWSSSMPYGFFAMPKGIDLGVKQASALSVGFAVFCLLAVIAWAAYVVFIKWKKDIKSVALLIFLCGLLPVFFISFVHYPYTAPMIEPHWCYFSSFGFFVLLGCLVLHVKSKINIRMWMPFILSLVCVYGIFLKASNAHWQDQETYCRYWLSLNKGNMIPFYGLGKSLLDRGEYDEAIKYFNEGLSKSNYANPRMLADLGYAHFLKGEKEAALANFDRALSFNVRYSVLHHYRAQYHIAEGNWTEARKDYITALQFFPGNKNYQDNLALVNRTLQQNEADNIP